MSQLTDIISAVKEKGLTKTELEDYRDQLSHLAALLHLEMAQLEKEEALFIDSCEEKTGVAKTGKWNVTERGQRQIEIKHYIRATDKILSSLKSRLYSMY